MAVADAAHQIGHVQERCFIQANINKCRLHARQHTRYFTQVNIAHKATLKRPFNQQFLQRAMLHHGHTGFLR